MGEPEPRDKGEAQEERDKPAGLVGEHAGQIPAGLRPPEDVDQWKDQQRDGDGNDRVEKGDEPVEPAFSTHPRRLGTRRGHAFTTPPLIAVITKGTTTNTPSSMHTTSSSPVTTSNRVVIVRALTTAITRRSAEYPASCWRAGSTRTARPRASVREAAVPHRTHSCWPGTPSRIDTSSTL